MPIDQVWRRFATHSLHKTQLDPASNCERGTQKGDSRVDFAEVVHGERVLGPARHRHERCAQTGKKKP